MARSALSMAALLCVAGSGAAQDSYTRILGVGMISYHGDRDQLIKGGDGFVEDSEGTLTEEGYERMMTLGTFLRENVADKIGLNVTADRYRLLHQLVHAQSTGFDRTIASGNAVLEGLLGHIPRRPVVYSQPDVDDTTTRAYSKCTSFREAVVKQREEDPEYTRTAKATLGLRQAAADYLKRPLEEELYNVWNTYDELLVANTEEGAEKDDELQELLLGIKTVLDSVSDFDYQVAKKHVVAGHLLREVNDYIRDLESPPADVLPPVYRHWFAHYPTIISLTNLLGLPVKGVPPFGATLYFAVQMTTFEDGVEHMNLVWHMLTPESVDDATKVTGFDQPLNTTDLMSYYDAMMPKEASEQDWCMGCETKETAINVCRKYFDTEPVDPEPEGTKAPVALKGHENVVHEVTTDCPVWQGLGLLMLGLLLGVLGSLIVVRMRAAKSAQKYNGASTFDGSAPPARELEGVDVN